jgi:hypothetical protein
MNAPRMRTLLGLVLLAALLLACASTGPPRVWTDFPATYSNFRRYLDQRGEDLDPIEGVWSPKPTPENPLFASVPQDLVIIRDSSYEGYEYVGVLVSESQGVPAMVAGNQARVRGTIWIALRPLESKSGVYQYVDAAVLRGEKCYDYPCHGICVITEEGELVQARDVDGIYWPRPRRIRRYPPP